VKNADIHITEAECEVLEALWRKGPLTPLLLFAEVRRRRDWADTTIKTLLARLISKRAARAERQDGVLRYYALIARDDYVAAEVAALVERLFNGDRGALAAFLARQS